MIMPALAAKTPDALGEALKRKDVRDTMSLLADQHERGSWVAAACTGTYVLAASGLLDGLRATTTWWLGADFRSRFPRVQLVDSKMVVDAEGRITAGAALAHVDLALWLIRQQSPDLARMTARYLLIDGRPSQSTYAMVDHLAHADPLIDRFERYTRAHLRDFSMSAAARAAGTSERTLQRHLRKTLGRTPIAYVRDMRVQKAVHLLRTTDAGAESIAEAVGYRDGVTLRTLLRTKTGKTLRELRE
jgi:transcriptional regulator GlxA family with amidase domain